MTFVSQASLEAGIGRQLGLESLVLPVKNTRGGIGKKDMVLNDADAEDRGRPGNLRGARRRRTADLRAGRRAAAWRSAISCSDRERTP